MHIVDYCRSNTRRENPCFMYLRLFLCEYHSTVVVVLLSSCSLDWLSRRSCGKPRMFLFFDSTEVFSV